jgi:tetratricopeptide (TPR) repeat protein
MFTGLFVASLAYGADGPKPIELSFRENPRFGFVVTLLLTFSILASIGGMYGLTTRFLAEVAYQHAGAAANQGNVEQAGSFIDTAIRLNPADAYYRFSSNVDLVRMQQLLSQNKAPEEIKDQFQQLLARAIGNAQQATTLDPNNYQNWSNLGSLYQSVIPLGIDGAVDSAVAAYDRALTLRPSSPDILLARASLERARNNTADARTFVQKAIDLRPQYTDAIFLLAQMQLEDNDVASAMKSVQAVTMFDPQNPVAYFQLGLLKYGSNDFVGAAQAFERAVQLNDVYANARYFLGLSYWRLGSKDKALEEFKKVRETNPDNADVASIVTNMEAGRDPFQSVSPSADIQDLANLPVGGADAADAKVAPTDQQNLAH